MTPGQAVKNARKQKGWTQERLGKEVGLGQATISALENDEFNSRIDPHTLIRISEVLSDSAPLVQHCEKCPVRLHLVKKHFDLPEDQRQDLATILGQLREEMGKALRGLDELGTVFSTDSFEEITEARGNVKRVFEQLMEIERGIGILRFQMMLNRLLS